MNCKRTWFGYVNYILATLLISAAIVAVIDFNIVFNMVAFINNPDNGLVYSNRNFPEIAAMFIGAGALCLCVLLFYGVRKLREKINKDNGIFDNDNISNSIGSVLSFIIFVCGIIIRVLKIIDSSDKKVSTSINLNEIENSFNADSIFHFSSFEDIYNTLIRIIYRFFGIKTDAYMWVNLALQILIILLIYSAVRNLFNSFVAVLPLIYYCFSTELIRSVVNGGYENLRIITCLLGIVIFSALITLFKDYKYYSILNLIVSLVIELVFIIILPLIYTGEIGKSPKFDLKMTSNIADIFNPFGLDFVCLIMLIFMLFASISFFFSNKDSVSLIFPVFIICLVFFLFSKNTWPTDLLMYLLFWTYAGLGLDQLILSQVSTEYLVDKSEKTNESIEPLAEVESVETIEPEETFEPAETIESEETIESPENIEPEETIESTENIEPEEEIEPTETVEPEEITEIFNNTEENCVIEENEFPEIHETPVVEETVQLLVSPLPLPKKHEKKEIAFAYEPSLAEMEFDIEISEDDDFDI